VLGWMSAATARFAALESKGRIAVGADADLVVFAPDATFTVHAAELQHKNPVTAFDGRELRGVVRQTLLAGRRVDIAPGAAPTGALLRAARP